MEQEDTNNGYEPFNLKNYETFTQDDRTTRLKILMSLDASTDTRLALENISSKEEYAAVLEASVKYGILSATVAGFRIQDHRGKIIDTILPSSFTETQKTLLSSAEQMCLIDIELNNFQANLLKQTANDHNCLMGDVLTVGVQTRRAVKNHYNQKRRVIAILPDSDQQYLIVPIS
jgi:hypothetical protein